MMVVTPTEYAAFAREIGLDLMGSNCGIGPVELMDSTVELMSAEAGLPIIEKENCGIAQSIYGEIHFQGGPELMAEYALNVEMQVQRLLVGVAERRLSISPPWSTR